MNIEKILKNHKLWLKGAGGSRGHLSGANLIGVHLSGANLSGANLIGAHLSDANLSDANLSDVDLSGANLSGANLSGANLSGANLSCVNLSCAYLSGAIISDGFACDGTFHHISNTGSGFRTLELYSCGTSGWFVKIGSFSGSVTEFLAEVEKTYGDNEYGKKYKALINAICI